MMQSNESEQVRRYRIDEVSGGFMVFHGHNAVTVGEQSIFPDLISVHRIVTTHRREMIRGRLNWWMDKLARNESFTSTDRASLIGDLREAYVAIGKMH
jgi:hypothetical protein